MALELKSQRQIQAQILAELISLLGLNDVNRGSVLDVLTNAVARQDFAQYYRIAQVSRLINIDALTGSDLDAKAFEYGLTRVASAKASNKIIIQRPEDFVKVSTTFYAGSAAPVSGVSTIDVNDASSVLIGTTGTLVLGRDTNNEEEVTYSVAPTDMTTFWRFTLDDPLTEDHSVEETVILKQGDDEVILAGTAIVVAATGVSEELEFLTLNDSTLLSGEDQVEDVEVIAAVAGTSGNIPIGAISGTTAFTSPPFTDARAYNDTKFTNGKDLEIDDDLRDRLKKYIQGISKAVRQAILNAIVGLVDPDTSKRVVSASVILPVEDVGAVKVYIDDGGGFEPSFEEIGFETVLSSASGGEQRLQLDKFPIVKAQIESLTAENFDFSAGAKTLVIQVGNLQETVTFNPDDFATPAIATADEVAATINDEATLVEARTSQLGKYIVLQARADTNESIQVISGTANSILNFPTDQKETLQLYIDDVLKSKDGQTATIDSGNLGPYDFSGIGAFPHELTLIVDGKSANVLTASFGTLDCDDPAAVTPAEVAAVINRDIPGVVASALEGGQGVRIVSLTELSADSKLEITGGSMNDATDGLDFDTTEVVGVDGDYIFNRELGLIQLATPLTENQNVTIGSRFTRAYLRAGEAELYAPAVGETLVISIDNGGNQTITFDITFSAGLSAELTAAYINATLLGGTAYAREIGGINYLEIRSNTYDGGTIEIQGSSTSNAAFGFSLDTVATASVPNKAYVESVTTGPYSFAELDSLVAVVDNDIVDKTFSILMNYNCSVTATTSTTIFEDAALGAIFPSTDSIKDFYLAFKTGPNTVTDDVGVVTLPGGTTARYTFAGSLTGIAAGDLIKITGMDDEENNGYFVLTAVGGGYVEVINDDAVAATGQTGTAVISQRRRVTAFNYSSGQITVGVAFGSIPVVGNTFIVMPSTVKNVINYVNNTKITSFSLKGVAEGSDNNTRVQLSSLSEGSDGYIQVTGGNANRAFAFPITLYKGIQGYSYYIGLLSLCHKVIYGDDSDQTSYPGVGAAGITFRFLAPTVRSLDIQLDVTVREGVTISSIENEIKSAVSGYVNTLGVGNDVILEQIRAAVIGIPGVTDVSLISPVANIAIADNENAFVSDPNITIG